MSAHGTHLGAATATGASTAGGSRESAAARARTVRLVRAAASATLLAAALSTACGSPPPPAPPPTPPVAVPTPEATMPGPDRTRLPEPWQAPAWSPPGPTVETLSNGMQVWFLDTGVMPVSSVWVGFPQGAATDPRGKEGLTDFMASLLDEGAGTRSAAELSDALQRLATDFSAFASTDALVLTMSTLTENFGASMDLLGDLARRPRFARVDVERELKLRLGELAEREDRPTAVRDLLVRRALFGAGYGGWSASGTRSTMARVTPADVLSQHRAVVKPRGAFVVVSGPVDRARARADLERAFGSWQGAPTAKARKLDARTPAHTLLLADFPDKPQSAISVARRARGASAPDLFPAMVYDWLMGGAFTSRINLNLRENKGYTYGARSAFSRMRQAGWFSVDTNVVADKTGASITEIFAELAGPCGARPIVTQERNDAVGGLLLGFPARFEEVGSVAAQLYELPLYGRGKDWFQAWPSLVANVDLAGVDGVAKESCKADEYVVVVAGDRKKLEAELQALGLPIHAVDHTGEPLPAEATVPGKATGKRK